MNGNIIWTFGVWSGRGSFARGNFNALEKEVSVFCHDALEHFGNDENSDPKVLKTH